MSGAQHVAKCQFCGKPATCVGAYEGSPSAFACDECCGHGCEDGKCYPLPPPDDAGWQAYEEAEEAVARELELN